MNLFVNKDFAWSNFCYLGYGKANLLYMGTEYHM